MRDDRETTTEPRPPGGPAPADTLYRLLFTLTPSGVVLTDSDGRLLEFNDRAHEQLGYTREEFSRLSIADLDPDETGGEIRVKIQALAERGYGQFEVRHRTKSGDVRNVLVTSRPVENHAEKRFLAVWQDVTEWKRTQAALRQTESLLSAFSDSIPDPMFLKDRESRFLFANPATLAVIGKPAEQVIGRSDGEIYDAATAEALIGADRRVMESGAAEVVEETLPSPTGPRVFLSTKVPYRDGDGNVIGVIGSARDITDRKRSEVALRQREEHVRTILQTALDGFYLVDVQGRIVAVNDAYCEMSGYSRGELLRMRVSDVEAVETPSDVAAHIIKIMAQGGDRFESRHRRKDGRVIDVENSVNYVVSEGGLFVCFVRDVTGRKQAERELRDREDRLRQTLQYASAGTWEWNIATGEVVWSPETYRLLGADRGDTAPDHTAWEQCVVPDDLKIAKAAIRDAIEGRTDEYHAEYRILHPTDGERWIAGVGRVERAEDGTPRRILGLHLDITDRKRAEEQARQAQKMESVARLAGGVAHDFNNLLTVIIGCADAIADQVRGGMPDILEPVEDIRAASTRARDLTRQLLTFSRRNVVAAVPLDLNAVVAGAEKLLRRVLREDIQLDVRLQPAVWSVRCDAGQLEQVIMNLAVNARDAMPAGGTIVIETRNDLLAGGDRVGEHVTLLIRDSGVGMSDDVKAHLFEPFFTTKPRGQGTGLGLATVYGIVKQSNGHIRVESQAGRGTTVEISFPRTSESPTAHAPRGAEPEKRGAETVLVVEDDPLVRGVTARALRGAGYRVMVAESGEQALAISADELEGTKLVVTDVVMPGMDGRAMTDRLRIRYPALRFLFVSGYSEDIIATRGALDDGIELLPKPFTTATLLAKVRDVLDRR